VQLAETTLEFNAKVTGAYSYDNTESLLPASVGSRGIHKMTASFSSKSTSRSGGSEEKEFGMKVSLTAVQDELPRGFQRLLSVLEDAITQD
jgi:hypothetical protein